MRFTFCLFQKRKEPLLCIDLDQPYDPSGAIHKAVLAERDSHNTNIRAGKPGKPAKKLRRELLNFETILLWADAHFIRCGKWPNRGSGSIVDSPGDTWNAVQLAMRRGSRGLPGGTTLTKLLAERRDRYDWPCLRLDTETILRWANTFHAKTGRWPGAESGKVEEFPDLSWAAVVTALRTGAHGLPSGQTLAKLLYRNHSFRISRQT